MRAARAAGPRRRETVETPEPRPTAGSVVVRPEQVAVCGSDLPAFGRQVAVPGFGVPGQPVAERPPRVVLRF